MTWLLWILSLGWVATSIGMWKCFERIHNLQMNLKDQEMEKAVAQETAKLLNEGQSRFDTEKLQLAEMIQNKM